MRVSEWVVAGYYGYLFVLGLVRRLPAKRRLRIMLVSLAVVALLQTLREFEPDGAARELRDWVPALLLIGGYWLSGFFYERPMEEVEWKLRDLDDRLFGRWYRPFVERAPRLLLEALESAYLFCYPLVLLGLAILLAEGHRDAVDRYWTVVLAAEFISYGFLPWVQTRPPRVVEPPGPMDQRPLLVRRLNLFVLGLGSIQVNTIPSGHAAGAVAVALAVGTYVPAAALPLGFIAAGIIVSSVLGRYHYALDAVAGLAVAVVVRVVAW